MVQIYFSSGKNQLMGDMLCLGGAVLLTVVTVLQELSVKTTDVVEYLGLLGLFGSIVSGGQMYEKHSLRILTKSGLFVKEIYFS